jgi:hypothetical protein
LFFTEKYHQDYPGEVPRIVSEDGLDVRGSISARHVLTGSQTIQSLILWILDIKRPEHESEYSSSLYLKQNLTMGRTVPPLSHSPPEYEAVVLSVIK